jgi:predicted GNAT family acetyltransferase
MSSYEVIAFAPPYSGQLAEFAERNRLIWADFASIAVMLPEQPRVWLAIDTVTNLVEAAAIDDGLSMSVGGNGDAIDAIAASVSGIDEKLVVAGRVDDVRRLVHAVEHPRRERLEHFMSITRRTLPSLIEPVPIRIATEDDLPVLRAARVAALEEEYGIPVELGSSLHLELDKAVTRAVKLQGVAIWVEDGACAFTAQLIAKTSDAAMFGDLYTAPELRGAGRATRALSAFCAWLMSESEHVTLRVGTENTAAVRLYERVGFQVIDAFCSSLRDTPTQGADDGGA